VSDFNNIAKIVLDLKGKIMEDQQQQLPLVGNLDQQMDRLVQHLSEFGVKYGESVHAFKMRFLRRVLLNNRGNQLRAARELGMHRNTLSRILQELRIDAEVYKRKGVHDPHANAAFVRVWVTKVQSNG
jgi:DNA-binding NtrC family response regulator